MYTSSHPCLFTGVYVVFKISMLYERLVAVVTSLKLILRPEGQYGQYASESEVAEAGNQCAICQVGDVSECHLSG